MSALREERWNWNMLLKRNKRKSHFLTIGQREVETHGLGTGFWGDLRWHSPQRARFHILATNVARQSAELRF